MSGWDDEACAEEIEAGATIHLPLHELELGDLALGLAIRPRLGEGGFHRSEVCLDAFAKRAQQTAFCIGQPAFRSMR